MRVISQDVTLDVPYNDYQLLVIGAKYDVKVARIYCQSSYAPSVKIAEYSTNAKTLKAMEMLRKAYENNAFYHCVAGSKRFEEVQSILSEEQFQKATTEYFQFPRIMKSRCEYGKTHNAGIIPMASITAEYQGLLTAERIKLGK
ncbi:MAG: hypothetical protein ACLT33_01605 [Lachnospira pectinoschiza]